MLIVGLSLIKKPVTYNGIVLFYQRWTRGQRYDTHTWYITPLHPHPIAGASRRPQWRRSSSRSHTLMTLVTQASRACPKVGCVHRHIEVTPNINRHFPTKYCKYVVTSEHCHPPHDHFYLPAVKPPTRPINIKE